MIVNLSMVHYYITITVTQTTHGLRHGVCRNGSDAEVFCWRQGKQEQLTVPLPSWSTQSSRSIFEIGTSFHMSRAFNITNLQSKWLQESLDTNFPEPGIMEVWITGPSTYFIYQKVHRLLSAIVPSTCSHIRGRNLVRKCSCFAGHVMRKPLTWYPYMLSFFSGFPLIFHSRCQQQSPRSGMIWICPISTSDIPRSCIDDIQCTFHLSSCCCSWHNSFLLLSQVMQLLDGWWMEMWSMV